MLQIPASAIVSLVFANSSQQSNATSAASPVGLTASPSATAVAGSANSSVGSSATPVPSATAVEASTSQAVTITIDPPLSNSSNTSALAAGPLTAPTVARLLGSANLAQSQSALGFAVTQVMQSYRVGICGNGICEVGERGIQGNGSQLTLQGSCPKDCPVQYSACSTNQNTSCSGKGSCLNSQGVCDCFVG